MEAETINEFKSNVDVQAWWSEQGNGAKYIALWTWTPQTELPSTGSS